MSVVAVFKDCLKFSICIAKYVVCKRETKISDCKRKCIEIQIHKTIQLSFTCDRVIYKPYVQAKLSLANNLDLMVQIILLCSYVCSNILCP